MILPYKIVELPFLCQLSKIPTSTVFNVKITHAQLVIATGFVRRCPRTKKTDAGESITVVGGVLYTLWFIKQCRQSSGIIIIIIFTNRLVSTTAHGYHCAPTPTPTTFKETARSETPLAEPPTSGGGVVGSVANPPFGGVAPFRGSALSTVYTRAMC